MGCELNMKTQLTRRAIFDGIIRGGVLYLILTLYVSPYMKPSLWIYIISSVAGLVMPIVLASLSFTKYKSDFRCVKYCLISASSFTLIIVLEFLSNFIPFRIFPIRELSNADGLVIILFVSLFLILNLIGRFATIIVIWIKLKSN